VLPLVLSREALSSLPHASSSPSSSNKPFAAAASKKKPAASRKAAKQKQNDGWDWNDEAEEEEQSEADEGEEDEEEEEEAEEAPAFNAANAFAAAARVSHAPSIAPIDPVPASSKACFMVSGALTTPLRRRLAKLIARSRCALAPLSSGVPDRADDSDAAGGVAHWREVHVFTSVSSAAHEELPGITKDFAALGRHLTEFVRLERLDSPDDDIRALAEQQRPLRVQVHHTPLSVLPISAKAFVTPVAAPAIASDTAVLTSYPPSLHVSSGLMALSNTLLTTASTAAAAASAAPAAASSLLSGFSVSGALSNLSKGLSEHIREAEMIALQDASSGAGGHDDHAGTARGARGGAAGRTGTTSSSGPSAALSSSLASSLANTLASMRVAPDFFAVGLGATELARETVSKLKDIKQAAIAAEVAAEKKSNTSSSIPAAAGAGWSKASVVLVDRSLDLLSVSRHHSAASSLRDRLHDHDHVREAVRRSAAARRARGRQQQQRPLTDEQIRQKLLNELDQLEADGSDGTASIEPLAMDERDHLEWRPEHVAAQMFTSPASAAWAHAGGALCCPSSAASIFARSSLFPAAASTRAARELLSALDNLAASSSSDIASAAMGAGIAATAAAKSTFAVLRKHLAALLKAHKLPVPSAGSEVSPSLGNLHAGIAEMLRTMDAHPSLQAQERQVYELCFSALRSAGMHKGDSNDLSSVLYDRIWGFEAQLQSLYIASALGPGSSYSSSSPGTNGSHSPTEAASQAALRQLVDEVEGFVRQINEQLDSTRTAKKPSAPLRGGKQKGSKQQHQEAESDLDDSLPKNDPQRFPLLDLLRLLVFLYSLIGGRHLLGEDDSRRLKALLREQIAKASPAERTWFAQATSPSSSPSPDDAVLLTAERTEKLVDAFFRHLQAISLARSTLSASDLIDLCAAPDDAAEEDDEAASGNGSGGRSSARFVPFVSRLLARALDPEALLDDLEIVPFDEEEEQAAAAAAAEAAAAAAQSGDDSAHSSSNQGGAHGSSHPLSSSSHLTAPSSSDGFTSAPAPPPPSSSPSSWGSSFFGSLASVVSSVAASAVGGAVGLSALGFGAARRPVLEGQERDVIVFVLGGVSHEEVRQIAAMGTAWTKQLQRQRREQARADGKASLATPPPPTVLLGSTHVATARDLVQQLLQAAARSLDV
jgi:hypothetical protein